MKLLFFLSLSVCLLVGCGQEKHYEENVKKIAKEEKAIQCKLELMKDSIVTEWNNVNRLLEENLPQSMPQEERNNMLKVKNANLIRMFESFDHLNEQVKKSLAEVEKKDMAMSEKVNLLKKDIEAIEAKKNILFDEISKQDETVLSSARALYDQILNSNCEL